MNAYRITAVRQEPDWSAIPAAPLLPCRWSPSPPPRAQMQAAWIPGRELLIRLESFAAPARAVNTEADSAVWEDSCLECFFSFDGRTYVNLEANANGALRASFGPDRHARRFLREMAVPLPRAETQVASSSWTLRLAIPLGLIPALWAVEPASGLSFTGNFYSCGDKTPAPHYAAWSPVETETPDFHRPEFFGTLILLPDRKP